MSEKYEEKVSLCTIRVAASMPLQGTKPFVRRYTAEHFGFHGYAEWIDARRSSPDL